MQVGESLSAVVTGGASGLGEAVVRKLAAAGVKVAIFDLNAERGQAIASEIGALFCQVDVMSDEAVDAGFAAARARNGQERLLVNCAGTGRSAKTVGRSRKTGEIVMHATDAFAWHLMINTVGTFRCITRAAAGMMELDPVDGERGAIVNTASAAAQDGQVGQVGYAAAKAAIVGMTLPIARDLSDEGIRVNTIMPGIFDTPPMMGVPAPVRDGLEAGVPFPKRFGRPDEFASMVIELARNGYMNGETIRLDGALRMPPK